MNLNPFLLISLSLISNVICAQMPTQVSLGKNPMYFVDSLRITTKQLAALDVNKVTLVTVITNDDALERFGEEGKDGIVYVETIDFVKRRYLNYFRSKGNVSRSIKKIDGHDRVQFVLNDKPLQDKDVGNLNTVNDETLKEFVIIKKKALKKKYKVKNKDYGIVIKT